MMINEKFGVNRLEEYVGEVYVWFQAEFDGYLKENGGIVDLNRYYYLALDNSRGEENVLGRARGAIYTGTQLSTLWNLGIKSLWVEDQFPSPRKGCTLTFM